MNLKTLRIAALAATFLGSAVAANAAETMMDKPVVGKNTTMTAPDTGGPIQKAGATKHGAMMTHKKPKKPKKGSMHHMRSTSSKDSMEKMGGPGGKGEPKTGM